MKKIKVGIALPKVAQRYDYDCGAAALKSIYEYEYPDDVNDISKYIKLLGSSEENGTNTKSLELACKVLGLTALSISDMSLNRLLKELDRKNPVLCLIRSNDHGHFVIAIGYDKDLIFFEDPFKKKYNGYLSKNEFYRRWTDGDNHSELKRFGLVIKSDYSGHNKTKTIKANKITGD